MTEPKHFNLGDIVTINGTLHCKEKWKVVAVHESGCDLRNCNNTEQRLHAGNNIMELAEYPCKTRQKYKKPISIASLTPLH